MDGEQQTSHLSSWLTHPWMIVGWFVLFVIAVISQRALLMAFFLFSFSMALFSRIWSRHILKKVSVEITTSNFRLFPGQEMTMHYQVNNKKVWPLIWLQWKQIFWPKGALVPSDPKEWESEKIDENNAVFFYSKRTAWILWHGMAQWESSWKAQCRGIYTLDSITLASGDGFGLSAATKNYIVENPLHMVVYPKLVPVDADNLFRKVWGTKFGTQGFIEEPTLNKGIRDFKPGDPWKKINWRLAALQRPLQVNIYETLKYDAIHFIVDVQSFLYNPCREEDFEDALSILASAMVALCEKNIAVGLSVPSSGPYPVAHYSPGTGEHHLMELLEGLARLLLESSGNIYEEIQRLSINNDIQSIFWVTYQAVIPSKLKENLNVLGNRKNIVLTYQDHSSMKLDSFALDAYTVIPMRNIKTIKD